MMPLTLAAVGEEAMIRKVGGKADVKKHLEDLGFVAGGNVTVIAMMGGNVIVNIKESRIAISREMAGKIMRVAIASLLLADKEILVFDEPTSGLDYCHMKETAELFRSLLGKRTLLIITHDPELILSCCTHVLHMENGEVSEFYSLDGIGGQRLIDFFVNNSKEEKAIEKAI